MSISSPSSPMVSPIHTPLHHNNTSVYQENIESSTSLPGIDITAILMDIQRQLKNQNDNFSELSKQVKLNQENIAQLVRGNHVAENNANMHDFSQNSCLDFNRTSIEQHNQVLTAPQLAANTSTNNPYTSCPVSTNPIRVSSHVQQLQNEEPKPRSPFFNGKGDFKAFWTQFRLLSSRFKWSSDRQVEELILNSLRDDALVFVNELPASLHRDIQQIHDAMSQRFGDHILPETYRTNLQFIKQGQKESIQEYATRVERLVGKAYPEVNDLSLLDLFKTEHFIKGLPDQSVAYEVLIQKPVSLQEAINQVSWLQCCRKNVGKKYEVRQVNAGDDVAGQEVTETLQVCRTQDQYITHSELKSGLDELRKEHQVAIQERSVTIGYAKSDEFIKLQWAGSVDQVSAQASECDRSLEIEGDKSKEDKQEYKEIQNLETQSTHTLPSNDGYIKKSDTIDIEHFDGSEEDTECEVVIDRVSAVTIKAPLSIGGQPVKAVIDTGAEVTVINESLLDRFSEETRPTLEKAKRSLVVAEAGKKMKTQGVAVVDIVIGDLSFPWEVYVAPIRDDVLLGCDIIDEFDITINTRRGIEVGGTWVDCEVMRRSDNISRIFVSESITIPANSEVILEGKGHQSELIDTRYASVEPCYEETSKILIARCLVDPFNDKIPVRVANLENFPVKLKKNVFLGEMHPVIDFEQVVELDKDAELCNDRNSRLINRVCSSDICNLRDEKGDFSCPRIPYQWKSPAPKIQQVYTGDDIKGLIVWRIRPKFPSYQTTLMIYMRRVVRMLKMSEIAAPLSKLTRKEVKFKWDSDCQSSFDTLRAGKKHQNADALSRKNVEDDRCSHLREGKTDATCQECLETGHDWDNFRTEVDDIGNLSKGEVSTHGLFDSIRTVTRSQTKDTPSSKVNVSNWFTGYTCKEIEALQRMDTNLGRLHEWKDTGACPTRDQVVQYSPAIRKYWLSFNNIVPVEGVLYQKRVHSTGTSSLQILVPKVLRQEVITMCHDHIFGALMGAESIPRQGMVVQTEESVSLSDVVAMEDPTNITEEDILQKAVKYAEIQEEEDFIPDYDDYSSDDITVINKPKDNSCQTDEDLPQRVSLLEEQLKIQRETHKIETNKLADFIKRLQTRLDQKEEEVKNLNSMIVIIDEYENLPKYGTRSSHALDGFEELWNNPDEETVRLQEKFQDTNNNTSKRPMNKSPSPTKMKLKSVVIRPKSSVEVWKEFAHKVNKSYKKDLLPRKGYRF
ncbi:unnamed protein product [Mytilus coruscus]|uniref:Peptidase A2 domain-containing protein n=1 Tax=Mytilus coruscus TaxID=42192 RepID=A0A6J8DIF2_MYTCO|nr:unnamed protein product [Mytilus coruscus]